MIDDVVAFEWAYDVLLNAPPDTSAVGLLWRQHAAAHLATRFDTALRGGVRRPSNEEQALAFLKESARELRLAAAALHEAAEKFRTLGHGYPANRTFHAATAAERAAERLDPG